MCEIYSVKCDGIIDIQNQKQYWLLSVLSRADSILAGNEKKAIQFRFDFSIFTITPKKNSPPVSMTNKRFCLIKLSSSTLKTSIFYWFWHVFPNHFICLLCSIFIHQANKMNCSIFNALNAIFYTDNTNWVIEERQWYFWHISFHRIALCCSINSSFSVLKTIMTSFIWQDCLLLRCAM